MFGIFRSRAFAICLVVFGVFLVYAGHKNAVKFAALRDHGKTAKAEITNLEWKEKKASHADGQYTAHIHFATEEGRDISAEVGVPAELGRSLRNQSVPAVMTVRYLPEDPQTLEDVNKDDSSDAQKGVGRYMVLAGIAILAVRFFFSKRVS